MPRKNSADFVLLEASAQPCTQDTQAYHPAIALEDAHWAQELEAQPDRIILGPHWTLDTPASCPAQSTPQQAQYLLQAQASQAVELPSGKQSFAYTILKHDTLTQQALGHFCDQEQLKQLITELHSAKCLPKEITPLTHYIAQFLSSHTHAQSFSFLDGSALCLMLYSEGRIHVRKLKFGEPHMPKSVTEALQQSLRLCQTDWGISTIESNWICHVSPSKWPTGTSKEEINFTPITLPKLLFRRTANAPNWLSEENLQLAYTRKQDSWLIRTSVVTCLVLGLLCGQKVYKISQLEQRLQNAASQTSLSLQAMTELETRLRSAEETRHQLLSYQTINHQLFNDLNTLQTWADTTPEHWVEHMEWSAKPETPWKLRLTSQNPLSPQTVLSSLQKNFPSAHLEHHHKKEANKLVVSVLTD